MNTRPPPVVVRLPSWVDAVWAAAIYSAQVSASQRERCRPLPVGVLLSPARLRRAFRQRPLLLDVVLATAALGVSLSLAEQEPPAGWRPFDLPAYALTALVSSTLVLRRRAPFLVMVTYCALWASYVAGGYWPLVNSAGALLALYTVAAMSPPRVAATAAALAAVVWVYAGVSARQGSLGAVLIQSVAWTGVTVYLGDRARQLAVLAAGLRQQQAERAWQAVVGERVRIARELHDVVAHHMSVISVQAGLARYVLDSDPPAARTALDTVLQTSTGAMVEMRRLFTLLRVEQDDAPTAPGEGAGGNLPGVRYDPAPGVDRLAEVLQRVESGGVPVRLTIEGVPRPLPPGLDLCVFRVVQEGLTNVLKHAAPASATVTIGYESDRIVARVVDDGKRSEASVGPVPLGHGLIGMDERARVYGGTVTAGPRPEGGFEVCLTLPLLVNGARGTEDLSTG